MSSFVRGIPGVKGKMEGGGDAGGGLHASRENLNRCTRRQLKHVCSQIFIDRCTPLVLGARPMVQPYCGGGGEERRPASKVTGYGGLWRSSRSFTVFRGGIDNCVGEGGEDTTTVLTKRVLL